MQLEIVRPDWLQWTSGAPKGSGVHCCANRISGTGRSVISKANEDIVIMAESSMTYLEQAMFAFLLLMEAMYHCDLTNHEFTILIKTMS